MCEKYFTLPSLIVIFVIVPLLIMFGTFYLRNWLEKIIFRIKERRINPVQKREFESKIERLVIPQTQEQKKEKEKEKIKKVVFATSVIIFWGFGITAMGFGEKPATWWSVIIFVFFAPALIGYLVFYFESWSKRIISLIKNRRKNLKGR